MFTFVFLSNSIPCWMHAALTHSVVFSLLVPFFGVCFLFSILVFFSHFSSVVFSRSVLVRFGFLEIYSIKTSCAMIRVESGPLATVAGCALL